MLPDGWVRCRLGEIARIASGGTPDRGKPSYWGGDIPWVTTGEIRFNTITDTTERITAAGLKNSSAKLFPAGTLLMAMYGQGKTRGQVAKLGIEAATNQACAAINLNSGHECDYFFHVFAWKYDAIRKLGNAGTQQNLNAGIIKEIEVLVPKGAEQRRIAQVLSCWDKAIAVTVALLTNSRLQKDTLAAVLLSGKRRLLRESDWSKKLLSELIVESRVVGSGGDAARKLTVKLYGRGVVGKSDKRVGSASTNYYRRKAGQFIYSKLDFLNGAFGLVPDRLDGFESTLDLPAFDFIGSVSPSWFLHHVLRPAFYIGHLGLANGGRKARRVNPADLLRLMISTPGFAEQNAIGDALDVAIKDTKNFEGQLALLRQQKQALMQQLLTGKRSLRTLEPAAETVA